MLIKIIYDFLIIIIGYFEYYKIFMLKWIIIKGDFDLKCLLKV